MSYFSLFPQSAYDFNRDGVLQNVIDIYRSIRPIQNYVDQISAYRFYEIPNGARPDIVSQKLYGNSQYHWTFFLVNDFLHDGIGHWPMSQEDLKQYMDTEYSGVAIEPKQPILQRNNDRLITNHAHSIANRFDLGDVLTGTASGAKGTLVKKDIFNHQLVLKDVTGSFQGNARGTGITVSEDIKNSDDEVISTYHVYNYIDAPHHWYDPTDLTKTQVSNAQFFSEPIEWTAETRVTLQTGSVAGLTYPDNVVTNRSYINDLNDQRSKIRVIDAAFIQDFVDTFESMLNG